MSKEFLQLITSLKLERVKIKYDHYERIVKNMMWVASLLVAVVLAATFKNEIAFQQALLIIITVGIVIGILMLPIARKSDDVTEKEIPALIQSVTNNKGRK